MDTRKLNEMLKEISDLMYSDYLDSYYRQVLESLYWQLFQITNNLEQEKYYDKTV